MTLDISAPRPVLTPFTLRFVKDEAGARFDACAADSEAARDRILKAALAAGASVRGTCTIGLGVPTPRWAEATEAGIAAIVQPGGSVRDELTIEACKAAGVTMYFTGTRHFFH